MFIDALIPRLKGEPKQQVSEGKNSQRSEDMESKGANPKIKRKTLEFISVNLGGPQYQDRSSNLAAHLEQIIKLKPEAKDEEKVFFFQEATKDHIKDLLNQLFQDEKVNVTIFKDKEKTLSAETNGHAVIEGHKNWYIVAPDYKKMTRSETKLIDSLTGIANFISKKDMKKYSAQDKKTGYSYLITVIPKSYAKDLSELKVKRNNSQRFLETQVTHFLHHVGKPAMGWGDRLNYVLQVNTPELKTSNIHLSAAGTPYRRFLEIFSTALMQKNPDKRVPETRTKIVIDLDEAAKAAFFKKEEGKEAKPLIIAGDANFFRSAMGNEPDLFAKIIKPLLKNIFGINTNYPTGNSSFKATEAHSGYHPEELDITLTNRELQSTKVEQIPKTLTDHDLLRSEILL